MLPQSFWTVARDRELERDLADGLPVQTIAERLGCGRAMVYHRMRAIGLSPPRQRREA